MSIYYFDADAQVKYFIGEPGSAWIKHLADATGADGQSLHDISAADISRVTLPRPFA